VGYADAVGRAREAAAKEPGELAAALGISYEAYRDIEWFDDEITSVVSFRDVTTLAELIELDLRELFGTGDGVLTFAELAAAVRARAVDTPLEQLEDELGWELANPLADPEAFAEFSLDGLSDVATPLGLDWRQLLPFRQPRRS
jgi:hypothetical protein